MADKETEKGSRPQTLSEETKKQIVQRLQEKGMRAACPMCSSNNWVLADGYFNRAVQTDLRGMVLGGPSIPSVAIICGNCGFMSEHALGVLGLLPRSGDAK